jgi:diguanylate cyclase (GGDEF)-like protein
MERKRTIAILLIEDSNFVARLIGKMLSRPAAPFALTCVRRLSDGLEALAQNPVDLIMLDLSLPDSSGLETFERVQAQVPDTPIIILTGSSDPSLATMAVQRGAQDYLIKGGIDSDLLLRSINYAIERQRLQVKLRNLSLTDELTGLHNRRGFSIFAQHHLKLARRINKGLWLFYIDIDKFKEINDTFGHQEGDRALLKLSAQLQETFRDSDVVARMGGDEFVVLSIAGPEEDSWSMALRLRERLDDYNRRGSQPYQLQVSIGLAGSDAKAADAIEQLLASSDRVLYEEKRKKAVT